MNIKSRSFVKTAIVMYKGSEEINNNFDMIWGQKKYVEDFIGGKAKFRIEFFGKLDIETFLTDPRTNCYVDFFFPKGWTRRKMLLTGLDKIGIDVEYDDFGEVVIKGIK